MRCLFVSFFNPFHDVDAPKTYLCCNDSEKRHFVHNEQFLFYNRMFNNIFIYREDPYVCFNESSDADLSYVGNGFLIL